LGRFRLLSWASGPETRPLLGPNRALFGALAASGGPILPVFGALLTSPPGRFWWPPARKPVFSALQQGPVAASFRPLFSGVFWSFSASFGPSARKRPNMALTGPCPVALSRVLGPFRPFSAGFGLFRPPAEKGPNPYRLVTGSPALFSRVWALFACFCPFPGPYGPQPPFFGFTARSFWASGPVFRPFLRPRFWGPKRRRPVASGPPSGPQMYHFWPFLVGPFGADQNTPSRGLPLPRRAPNVPLFGPFGPFWALFSRCPKIRRHSTAFLAEGQKGCRMPPDFGAPVFRAPKGGRRPQGPHFRTSVAGFSPPFPENPESLRRDDFSSLSRRRRGSRPLYLVQ